MWWFDKLSKLIFYLCCKHDRLKIHKIPNVVVNINFRGSEKIGSLFITSFASIIRKSIYYNGVYDFY